MRTADLPPRLLPAALVGDPYPAGRGLPGVRGLCLFSYRAKGREIPGIREVKESTMNNAMKIVNLTPHVVNVVGEGACTLPPSGQVARVSSTTTEVRRVNGIPCSAVSYGKVEGLPEPEEGTLYVVSALVRAAVPHRTDVASPGELVRDNDGKPIGCRGLAVNG